MSKEETAIEMYVGGLVLDPNTQAPVVVLKDESGEIHLPIWIGVSEATSIASAIKEINMGRPLTHDLMAATITEMGGRIERVVITELKDQTYYSELVITVGEKMLIFDSRPSDAIALALRAAAPIYVARAVIEQSLASSAEDGNKTASPPATKSDDATAAEGAEVISPSPDFKSIDKDKWNEVLESLDPDDFKYKT
jgi:bifunctional DNase/RNase